MLYYATLDELSLENTWLAVGTFDGVHRGHQAVLKRLVLQAHAQGATAAALTFHPHPAVILRGRSGPYYLTTVQERGERMLDLGVDAVIVHPFDHDVAALSAREFVQKLRQRLNLRRLVVGPDFALGHNREGGVDYLSALGEELGYQLEVLPQVVESGEAISSSRIRQALQDGDVITAAEMLGRPHSMTGAVVPGDGRGRTIGVPTANLDLPPDLLLPKSGVYACLATIDGKTCQAVTNIGVRPTFSDGQPPLPRLETHLLDFSEDLYGREVRVEFIRRLRDERRFESAAALVEQIHADIHAARQILAEIES